MTKHTPGPWTLSENFNWKTNPFSITVRRPGVHQTTIANIPTRQTITFQEQAANARLIAAAPDLLEALNDLVLAIRFTPLGVPQLKALEAAQAAIQQATGEQTK